MIDVHIIQDSLVSRCQTAISKNSSKPDDFILVMKPLFVLVIIATVFIASSFVFLLSSSEIAFGQPPDQALSTPSPSEQQSPGSAPPSQSPFGQTPDQALSSPSPSSNQTTAQQQEQQPSTSSSGILGLLFPQEQPPSQSTPIQPPIAAPTEGLTANGTIDSLIFTPGTRWIATGNWSMVLLNGNVNSFNTNMTWYDNNGTRTHTHELVNFKPSGGIGGGDIITVKPGDNLVMKGLMDVGTNHRITWKNVHSTIDIKGGKTISISLDDKETNKHFAGQTIYGVVKSFKSFTKCSDQPGPNMELPAPCRSSSSFSPSS
jgi:hypothetical protein